MDQAPATAVSCKNCSHLLSPEQRFCPGCGQSAGTHRLDLHHILHDLIHVFTHADKGFLYLTRELAKRPGLVVKEYVGGARKKYFNPFSYLVLTVAVSAFLTHNFNLLQADLEHKNPVSDFISRHINLVFLFNVPVFALFTRLLFRRSGYNYAENLTLHAFLGGFRVFFFILIFTPLVIFFRPYYYSALMTYLGIWAIFMIWANIQFFGGRKWLVALKSILALMLVQMTVTLVIGIVIFVRRRYGIH